MNIDARFWGAVAGMALLPGCAHDIYGEPGAAKFGEANKQTMMAQVIDPDPEYDFQVPDTSAQHAAQAVERYRTDQVKEPDTIRSTRPGGS